MHGLWMGLLAVIMGVNNVAMATVETIERWTTQLIVAFIVAVLVMWGINIAGYHQWNYIPTVVGVVLIGRAFASYPLLLIAAGGGGVVAFFSDRDITQGAAGGAKNLVLAGAFTALLFVGLGLLLSIVSFKAYPMAFPPIVLVLGFMGAVFVLVPWAPVRYTVLTLTLIVVAWKSYALYDAHTVANKPQTPATAGAGAEGGGGAASAPEGPQYTPPGTGTATARNIERRMAASASTPKPTSSVAQATWKEEGEDGHLPTDVWSQTYPIGIGCSTTYDAGNCVSYKVRFRMDSSEDWTEHKCDGGYPPASELQFMLLKPRKTLPFKVTC